MDGGGGNGERKGPAHARKRVLPRENEERLAEIGRQLPPPSDEELAITAGLRRSRRRRAGGGLGQRLVFVALCAGAVAQWVRPLPSGHLGRPGRSPARSGPELRLAQHRRGGGDGRRRGDRGAGPRDPARPGRRPGGGAGGLRRPVRPPPGTRRRRTGDPRHRRCADVLSGRGGEPGVRGPRRGRGDPHGAAGARGPPGRLRSRHGDRPGRLGRRQRQRLRRRR